MPRNYSNSDMVGAAQIYETVAGLTPYSTPHNLSYQTTGTGDMGILYPMYYQMCQPGDKLELNATINLRMQPHLAPLMHEVEAKVMYFFVPHRLIWRGDKRWNAWETWLTGAVEGTEIAKWNEEYPNDKITPPNIDDVKWNPYEKYNREGELQPNPKNEAIGAERGTIWESIGLPYKAQITTEPQKNNQPLNFIKRAYNQVWNDWYRDQNLQRPVNLVNDTLLYINWARDRFTSAGYDQQKGIAPVISSLGNMQIVPKNTYPISVGLQNGNGMNIHASIPAGSGLRNIQTSDASNTNIQDVRWGIDPYNMSEGLEIDQTTGSGFNVSDLRLLIALQKAMEIDMRTGSRYFEYIKTNFNTSPRHDVLQRAEYIGQIKTPIQMSEVLQTSATETNSPLGEMAGHGTAWNDGHGGNKRYYCQEHGTVIGIFVTVPRPQYQQGIPAELLINDKYEIYRPQFAYLSEEGIKNAEIYYTGDTEADQKLFGYNGRWDHMRIKHHIVTGLMRADMEQNLSFWNLARYFENRPSLTTQFIECKPRKDWLVVPDEEGLIINIGWHCYSMRKIPATSEPGLLDHVYGEGGQGNTVPRLGNSLR